MTLELRPYQNEAVRRVTLKWKEHDKVLLSMPTGSGKTAVGAYLADAWCNYDIADDHNLPPRVLWLAHRDELIDQAAEACEAWMNEPAAIEKGSRTIAKTPKLMGRPVVVSSIQTMLRPNRREAFSREAFGMVLIDECVSGDSLIRLADGTEKPIRSIVDDGRSVDVLTVDQRTGNVRIRPATGRKQAKATQICVVCLDDGSMLKCTPDHQIMTDRGWVAAAVLTPMDFVVKYNYESAADPISLRQSTRRRAHEARRPLPASTLDGPAQRQTAGVGHGQVRSFTRMGQDGPEAKREWWLGWSVASIQYIEPPGILCRVRCLLPEAAEDNKRSVAQRFDARGVSVVVHGRWFPINCWSQYINGRFHFQGAAPTCPMAQANLGCFRNSDTGKAGSLASGPEQARRPRLLRADWTVCDTLATIQTISRPMACLPQLRGRIYATQEYLWVLWSCSMPENSTSGIQRSMVSKGSAFPPETASRSNTGETAGQALRGLRKSICDRKELQDALWKGELQKSMGATACPDILPKAPPSNLGKSRVASVRREEVASDVFDLEIAEHHSYFANGLLVHNCHHAVCDSYQTVLDYFRPVKMLGATATTDRSDEAPLGKFFDTVAYHYDLVDAIQDGWLCPIKQQYVHVDDLDWSKVRKTGSGDLSAEDLDAVIGQEAAIHKIVAPLPSMIGDRQTLIFTPTVRVAEMIAEIMPRYCKGGVQYVSGKTPEDERRAIVEAYRRRDFQTMVNCGVFLEGTDFPAVSCIVFARLTLSRMLYAQMGGRGLRGGPMAPVEGKEDCLFIDLVGASMKHKLQSGADLLGGALDAAVKDEARARIFDAAGETPADVMEEILACKAQADDIKAAARAEIIAEAKASRTTIDPFTLFADAVQYVESEGPAWWQNLPPDDDQVSRLKQLGIPAEGLTHNAARELINEANRRSRKHQSSYKQMRILKRCGFDANMTQAEASDVMTHIATRPGGWKPSPEDFRRKAMAKRRGRLFRFQDLEIEYTVPADTECRICRQGQEWQPFVTTKESRFHEAAERTEDGAVFRRGEYDLSVQSKQYGVRVVGWR